MNKPYLAALLSAAFVVSLAASPGFAAQAHLSVPITLINYSQHPVHATAISLDQQSLCQQLAVPAGTPIAVVSAEQHQPQPVLPGTQAGRPVVRVFVSLPAGARLNLLAEPADQWAEPKDIAAASFNQAAGTGVLANGVLKLSLGADGWILSLDGPDKKSSSGRELLRHGSLDNWFDQQNRGRMLFQDPEYLGLLKASTARLENCETNLAADGGASVKLVRHLDGFAKELTFTETFELLPGLPVLRYHIRWENAGEQPLFVAYIRYGGGLKGQWGNLLAKPLFQKERAGGLGTLMTPALDILRPGATPRVAFESPATGCGLGASTLSKIQNASGSMVWKFSDRAFEFNFFEPHQGQFPFVVKKDQPAEAGFAFVATQSGADVRSQTEELFQNVCAGQVPQPPPPCAVFVGDAPLCAQEVTGFKDSFDNWNQWQGAGPTRQAALNLDFSNPLVLRAVVANASPEQPLELTARPLQPGAQTVSLLRTVAPGQFELNLNQLTGWTGRRSFVLQFQAATEPRLKSLELAEAPAQAPELVTPLPGAHITDLAAEFRWKSTARALDYEIQFSRTENFTQPETVAVQNSARVPWYLPDDDKLPRPGTWYWRVRAIKNQVPGQWSLPWSLTVNDEHPLKALKRPLTPHKPVFTIEATRARNFLELRPEIPQDIRPYVGIVVEGLASSGLPVDRFARGLDQLPYALLMRGHHPSTPIDGWASLGDWEWLFQNVPNFVGVQGGESLSWFNEDPAAIKYTHRLLRLCAKYGMFFQEADGTYDLDKWQDLMDQQGDFIRQYGQYLVLSQKNNIIRRQFMSQSAALGLWLGGITYQHGAWEDGGWYWQNAGFVELGQCLGERRGSAGAMPGIFWDLVFVMGVSRGCTLFSLDGQTLMVGGDVRDKSARINRSVIWNSRGETTDCFKRFVVPLIRGIVQHDLIPTREQVRQKVKLAVYNDKQVPGDARVWSHYVEYGPLYAATYGFRKMANIDGQLWEFFPNTGRYYFIPVLPQGNQPLGAGIRNLPVSALQKKAAVEQLFGPAYPKWYDGEALVCNVGDTWTVQNSRENEDVTESYTVPMKLGWLERWAGKVPPHAYQLARTEAQGNRFWLQANTEYPQRESELAFSCPERPSVEVLPASALTQSAWEPARKTLTLRLSHRDGAVEVTLLPARQPQSARSLGGNR